MKFWHPKIYNLAIMVPNKKKGFGLFYFFYLQLQKWKSPLILLCQCLCEHVFFFFFFLYYDSYNYFNPLEFKKFNIINPKGWFGGEKLRPTDALLSRSYV